LNQIGVPPHIEEEEKKVTIKLRPIHQTKPEEKKYLKVEMQKNLQN